MYHIPGALRQGYRDRYAVLILDIHFPLI